MEQTLVKPEKRLEKVREYLLFTYLAIFPLGQLLKFRVSLINFSLPLHLADIIIVIFALTNLFGKKSGFFWIPIFSYIFSFTIFKPYQLIVGGLYLLRLIFYVQFSTSVYKLVKDQKIKKDLLFDSLLSISFFIGFYGLLQYFLYPDIRGMTILGWDDHLYRLVSTFLDPGFTAIFLVFGFLVSFSKFLEGKGKRFLAICTFLTLSLALTYSRAGYLAFISGSLALLALYKKITKIVPIIVIFVIILLFIPNYGSEGVRLGRTKSIVARIVSYQEGFSIFKESPVFGVGYNNLCVAKEKFLGQLVNFESHACSGVESGFLTILATTGMMGSIIFVYLLIKHFSVMPQNMYGKTLSSVIVSLLTHNFFINSIFYPWVMGYIGVLIAITSRSKRDA